MTRRAVSCALVWAVGALLGGCAGTEVAVYRENVSGLPVDTIAIEPAREPLSRVIAYELSGRHGFRILDSATMSAHFVEAGLPPDWAPHKDAMRVARSAGADAYLAIGRGLEGSYRFPEATVHVYETSGGEMILGVRCFMRRAPGQSEYGKSQLGAGEMAAEAIAKALSRTRLSAPPN